MFYLQKRINPPKKKKQFINIQYGNILYNMFFFSNIRAVITFFVFHWVNIKNENQIWAT